MYIKIFEIVRKIQQLRPDCQILLKNICTPIRIQEFIQIIQWRMKEGMHAKNFFHAHASHSHTRAVGKFSEFYSNEIS